MPRRILSFLLACLAAIALGGQASATELPPGTVIAELYNKLAHINGDTSGGEPVLCFPSGVSSLGGSAWAAEPGSVAAIRREVAELGALLKAARRASGNPSGRIEVRVTGYADSTGAAAFNARLSYERARTIARLLQQAAGVPLAVEIEGRGAASAGVDFGGACLPPGRRAAGLGLAASDVQAHRRVEIEVLSSALTHADVPGNQALRLFPKGAMPWRVLRIVLAETTLGKTQCPCRAGGAAPPCAGFDTAGYPETPWVRLPTTGPAGVNGHSLDVNDGDLFARFLVFPVRHAGPSSSPVERLRLVLEIANSSVPPYGVPGYWALRLRLPLLPHTFENVAVKEGKPVVGWAETQACYEQIEKKSLAPRFAEMGPGGLTEGIVADTLPKSIEGLLLHVHRLDRTARFFDLRPGMSLLLRSTTFDPIARLAQPAGPIDLPTQPDPLDPCQPVPAPRPLADPFGVAVSDPFLAYLLSGRSPCRNSMLAAAAVGPDERTAVAPATGGLAKRDLLVSQLSFEEVLQHGLTRIYAPRSFGEMHRNVHSPNAPAGAWTFEGAVAAMTMLVSRGSREDLDALSQAAALSPSDPTAACQGSDGCAVAFGGLTYSPVITARVEGQDRRFVLGSRLVHALPADIIAPCFKNIEKKGQWPAGARLRKPLTISFPSLPPPLLVDKSDCRLLGLPLMQGSMVSW